jgi:hypothetical protein
VPDDGGAAAALAAESSSDGVASSAATTVTVPVISGWRMQSYAKVPTFVKVVVHLPPGETSPLSKDLSFAVTVWGSLPLLVNVTTVPTLTVREAGEKVLSRISTVADFLLPAAAGAFAAGAGVVAVLGAADTGDAEVVVCAVPAADALVFGAAVAAPPLDSLTTTVPTIPGCRMHLYVYVPAVG